jgi:hypothetical protein
MLVVEATERGLAVVVPEDTISGRVIRRYGSDSWPRLLADAP